MTLRFSLAAVFMFCLLAAGEMILGNVTLSWHSLAQGLLEGPFSHQITARILWLFRLPRLLLAFLTGATLAAAGALLQTATRNPLADPFLFGLSAGASAGAVAVIIFMGNIAGIWTTTMGAAAGALCATTLLLALITRSAHSLPPQRIILTGLAVSFLFTSVTNFLIFQGDRNTAQSVLFWTLGSFSAASWSSLPVAALALLLICTYGARFRKELDALLAGEDTATSLGVNVRTLRLSTLLLCALSCAMTVALCGPVGFLGLVVPHLARFMTGNTLKHMFFPAAILGGLTAMLADLLSHSLFAAQEIPTGILISGAGACFFLLYLRKI